MATILFRVMYYILSFDGNKMCILWGVLQLCKGQFVASGHQAIRLFYCFASTFLHTHSWLNWANEHDDRLSLKEKPENIHTHKNLIEMRS